MISFLHTHTHAHTHTHTYSHILALVPGSLLKIPGIGESLVTFMRKAFVSAYLCCSTNTQIVDSEMNVRCVRGPQV